MAEMFFDWTAKILGMSSEELRRLDPATFDAAVAAKKHLLDERYGRCVDPDPDVDVPGRESSDLGRNDRASSNKRTTVFRSPGIPDHSPEGRTPRRTPESLDALLDKYAGPERGDPETAGEAAGEGVSDNNRPEVPEADVLLECEAVAMAKRGDWTWEDFKKWQATRNI